MRQFTKEHNDLNWLFPSIEPKDMKFSENWFDEYERDGEYLLGMGYNDQQTFTRDDMIDAFMKGASEAHRFLVPEFRDTIRSYEYFEKFEDHQKANEKLLEIIADLQEENKNLTEKLLYLIKKFHLTEDFIG